MSKKIGISDKMESGSKSWISNGRKTDSSESPRNDEQDTPVFSVRLDQQIVHKVRAIAYWQRISQRELIEQALKKHFEDLGKQEIERAINEYEKV
jgi:hypothetical protein